jgi:DNA invertase Pin-like site-specific DNA recombinase
VACRASRVGRRPRISSAVGGFAAPSTPANPRRKDSNRNSLDAQREACEAYIKSQRHEGWSVQPHLYDDAGYSGGTVERPALKRLLADIAAHRIDAVVVYKVDRLTRSLADFARIVEVFDAHGVSFVSITQAFNTTTSMGRLTLLLPTSSAMSTDRRQPAPLIPNPRPGPRPLRSASPRL